MKRFFRIHEGSAPEFAVLVQNAGLYYPELTGNSTAIPLLMQKSGAPGEVSVHFSAKHALIQAHSLREAAHGLGMLLAGITGTQKTPFTALGIMLDVSRNKVFRVNYLKKLITQMALAGGNTLMLYAEDTYALDEPFFGYMRGGYTLAELQELDAFAETLGVEIIAAIQTLGHMTQYLQWQVAASAVTDTPDILKADAPETYALIEKMLAFWQQALHSRRIHIGMDEAHELGRGRWLDTHTPESQFEIFSRHLNKVNTLCRKYGYTVPTIWSDMYFRIGDPAHDYYGDAPIPEFVQKAIPENVQLCYWDYYHTDRNFYEHYIARHRELSQTPILVASGIWTWNKFWYDHNFSYRNARPCIEACKAAGVTELVFTMWGDDGGYCFYDSALAGVVDSFHRAWNVENEKLDAKLFAALTHGESLRRCIEFSRIESEGEINSKFYYYTPAAQLWDDPMLAIYHRGITKRDAAYPEKVAKVYCELLRKYPGSEADSLSVRAITALIRFLSKKLTFRLTLEKAWKTRDRRTLKKLAEKNIPELCELLTRFDTLHRESWLECAKPLGLEVIEVRNAGVKARLEACAQRLLDYAAGREATLEELDAAMPLPPKPNERGWYRFFASGSVIK